MRQPGALDQITIKVPAPFAGVAELGFSARYPEQSLLQPLRDVPLWIEGPADPMRRLAGRLRMLAALVQAAHGWTPPVALTDEVLVMAFQDRSGASRVADPSGVLDYVANLVRPVVFPFLHDCARVAHLRLTDRTEMRVRHADREVAELTVRWDQIVPANGEDLLSA
ncbi:MAG TPA: hypothetical protein VE953_15605 [Terriglobales bacterium]|nr:hypothetical protein [Terriglobales bacterium]